MEVEEEEEEEEEEVNEEEQEINLDKLKVCLLKFICVHRFTATPGS